MSVRTSTEQAVSLLCTTGNASLALLATAATLPTKVRIARLSGSADVRIMLSLIAAAGWAVEDEPDGRVAVGAPVKSAPGPLELAATIRASYYLVPALLTAFGRAELPWPSGYAIGERGMHHYFAAFEAFGDRTEVGTAGYAVTSGPASREPVHLVLPFPSGGATIAAVLRAVAEGRRAHISGPNTELEAGAVLSAVMTAGWRVAANVAAVTLNPPSQTETPTELSWTLLGCADALLELTE